MPTLAEWPKILASAAEAVLSVPEVGYTMPVHDFPPAQIGPGPEIIIEPGAEGIWIEPANTGAVSVLGQATARFTVRLVVPDPGSPGAAFTAADVMQRLYARFAAAVAADVGSGGIAPQTGAVLVPTAEEYAAVPVWSASLPVTVPFSKIPPSTP